MSVEILQRMVNAMNAHDLEALTDCFCEDFHSVLPIHPGRSFTGRSGVRKNWAGLFAHVPDLVAAVLQSVVDGDQVWSEWEMGGTTVDGDQSLLRGVAILRVRGEQIASVRFYLDEVDDSGDPTT